MVSLSFSLDHLIQFIADETDLFLGMKYKVKSFRNQLILIREYIRISGSSPELSNIEKKVIDQIRRIAFEAEDLISDYTTHAARHKKWITRLSFYTRDRQVAWKIDKLNNEIKEILKNKEIYASPGDHGREPELPDLDFRVNNVVDFVNDMEKLVNLLIKDDGFPYYRVISVVGMGGSGKTELAWKLFDDDRVKEHFDYWLWVNLDQGDSSTDILRQMVSELKIQGMNDSLLRTMNDDNLKSLLSQHFEQKKYLVVMDNIWQTQTWDQLKGAFPKDSYGSRIVITSRQLPVVRYTNSSIHYVPQLADSDSRELFCMKAFESDQFPYNLETMVGQVVRRCHGLPFPLLVLGRLLAEQEREEQPWSTFLGNPFSYPDEGRRHWRAKLATSYDQLMPVNLKLCFFYLGVFPDNHEIPVKQLIQLWIAEELIPQNDETSLENIAEKYLRELIDRCLVQVISLRLDGGVKTCCVHNVLRDLCVWESRNDDFIEVRMDSNSTSESKPRRLSVHFSLLDFINVSSRNCECASIRSFLCFSQQSCCMDDNNWTWLCQKMRVIRVLNLENVQVELIPEDIDELILLKYLKLKGKNLKVLPESIGKLWQLVTLDLRGSAVNCLPRGIWKLENLRHLCLSKPTKLLDPPPNNMSGSLPSIQAISNLVLDQESTHLITKAKFPLVKKLGLFVNNGNDVFENVCKISSLNRLKIEAPSSEHLGLQNSFCQLRLTKVTLVKSKINSNYLRVLGQLPELRILKLLEVNSDDDNLQCDTCSFAQLDVFQMTRFPIQNWILSEGAMPSLRRLIIKGCQQLKGLPERQRLMKLKQVCVHRPCSSELITTLNRMKSKIGDWCEIQICD
ncbi:hypothetical protein L6164_023684 [Bauhinia variegata]|uniref:Uncharacterized protein n=1 Tax=Bauhinia variegata TaxID=167791 RepID=A0ACB9MMI3_BAUVA|nr:hypothetical protein L6164_023684 [Bauhinia variegata]